MDKNKKMIIAVSVSVFVLALVTTFCVWTFVLRDKSGETQDMPQTTEAEATPEPTPEPTPDPNAGKVRSVLTGEYISKKVAKQRPFAIIINNIEYANQHQQGTSEIDVLYEALAEGGITRMLGVFQGTGKIKRLGSVRSARHYFVSFASEWNAIFCHFGQTSYAISKMEELGINNLSGLSAIGGVVYKRDNSLKAPHNVFTSGDKMRKGAKQLGYSLKFNEKKMAKHFDFYEEDTELSSEDKATYVYLPFSAYSTCYLKYDEKSKEYKKFEYKTKHKDHKNNKQLSFKNVIIQLVKETNIDRNGYQHLYLHKRKGEGYYITNGKRMKIKWRKNEEEGTMCYYDMDGNVLNINPGKTYIAAYPTSRKKLISFKNKK
ncbi:MAG: DUF3048 domain-containing protein [Roseburia sp.]|nr:DUF3048 domain-containing protein [Roseburia sp.]